MVKRLSMVLLACAVASCHVNEPSPVARAALLARKGREEDAVRLLREYVTRRPEAIEERRLLVRVYALTGDLGAAKAEAERLARRLGAGSPVPWLELGHALELAHRYDEALASYDRAALAAPSDPAGPRTGGMRAARWGEVELAEPRLVEALRRDSSDGEVWHALGLVRVHLGDLEGARKAYESGLEADPRALENRIGLATVAFERGDPASALNHYDAVLEHRPRFADGHLGRSWALLELGRYDEAEQALGRAVRLGAERRAARRQLEELSRRRSETP